MAETFREIADPYHSQSIRRSHTWRPILLPGPYSSPPSSTPPHPQHPSHPPHLLLQKAGLKLPHRPRGPPAKAQLCSVWQVHFARGQGAPSHSGGGTLEQQQQQGMGPAHCRVHISGASRPGGALTYPLNSLAPRFASNCKYICRICPNGISGSGETFPPLRTGLVCPVKGAP